jgi:hypothetical protein
VPVARGDLLAHDDLQPQPARPGERPRRDRGIDPLVVGDPEDVEVRVRRHVGEDRLDAIGPVRGERVDVQVRPAMRLRAVRPPG